MKILYAVQGTGNGHITRARAMISELQKQEVEISFLFSGRRRDKFFDMDVFGDYQWRQGLTFHCNNGQISYFKTLLSTRPATFIDDVKNLNIKQYDLVINDFEPVSAWAAKIKKVPILGISHQYAFNHAIPIKGGDPVPRRVMSHYAPVSQGIGLHWHHFDQPILPPIIESIGFQPVIENKILVYLPFESIKTVCQLLTPFTQYEFHIYTTDLLLDQPAHLHLKLLSREGFKQDLSNCTGIISNAGFELVSESLQLGKKILVKPLHSQMEQISNAFALKQLGYGQAVHNFDPPAIEDWLDTSHAVQVIYPNVAARVTQWLMGGIRPIDEEWVSQVWKSVSVKRVDHQCIAQEKAA